MTFKVLIIGDAGVGKTSLRTQFFHNSFTSSYRATIGANFLTKHMTLPSPSFTKINDSTFESDESSTEGVSVSLCLWDTAGQERFNSLSSTFFRGSDCAILVYDMTSRESLDNLSRHAAEFRRYSGTRDPVVVVVGNKSDAVAATVSDLQQHVDRILNQLSPNERLCHFQVSAKLGGQNITDVFVQVAKSCLANSQKRQLQPFTVDNVVDLKRPGQSSDKGASSCTC